MEGPGAENTGRLLDSHVVPIRDAEPEVPGYVLRLACTSKVGVTT